MRSGYFNDYAKTNEIRQLRKLLEDFESGERYRMITIEYERKLASKERQIDQLQSKCDQLSQKCRLLLSEKEQLEINYEMRGYETDRLKRWISDRDEIIEQQEASLKANEREIARLKAFLNTDSTNSGTSTAKTPLNKDKVRPNSRKKHRQAKRRSQRPQESEADFIQ